MQTVLAAERDPLNVKRDLQYVKLVSSIPERGRRLMAAEEGRRRALDVLDVLYADTLSDARRKHDSRATYTPCATCTPCDAPPFPPFHSTSAQRHLAQEWAG